MLTYITNGCLPLHCCHNGINPLGSVSQDLWIITALNCLERRKAEGREERNKIIGHVTLYEYNHSLISRQTTWPMLTDQQTIPLTKHHYSCFCYLLPQLVLAIVYTLRWKQWASNLNAYLLVLWSNYTMNETLIYQQAWESGALERVYIVFSCNYCNNNKMLLSGCHPPSGYQFGR